MANNYSLDEEFYDDGGNLRVDFVWGNVPPKPVTVGPNYPMDTRWGSVSPEWNNSANWHDGGYSMANSWEYVQKGHASVNEINEWMGNPVGDFDFPTYDGKKNYWFGYSDDNLFLGDYLDITQGNHEMYMGSWNNFPKHTPNVGWDGMYKYFSSRNQSAVGKHYSLHLENLRKIGVPEQYLKPMTFSGGAHEYDYEGGTPNWDGVIIWEYQAPETVLPGKHFNGSDWLASEVNNQVKYVSDIPISYSDKPIVNPADYIADVELGYPGIIDYMCVVVQTEDPNKDTFTWWD